MESQGYEVLPVRNINPKMSDEDILKIANRDQRILVTMDKDFGELVFRRRKGQHGVLLLRLDDANSDEKLAVVKELFDKHLDKLTGNFCVYQNRSLRVRPIN
ncbi:MAG: DUF5615 family PIN-like protein [bacterium]